VDSACCYGAYARSGAQEIAAGVPNVSQIVNKLEINQKATSTN
jgi:hypothetical protein